MANVALRSRRRISIRRCSSPVPVRTWKRCWATCWTTPGAAGQATPILLTGHGGLVTVEEHRHFRVRAQDAGVMPAVADIAAQRGGGTAGAGAAHDPFRNRAGLFGHLLEDGFGDVVVGAPVGRTFGV